MFFGVLRIISLVFLLVVIGHGEKALEYRDPGAPILNIGDEYIFTLNPDKVAPLVIICSGTEEVHWSSHIPNEYYIIDEGTPTERYPYQSIFEVGEPLPEDTGLIKCSYSNGATAWSYIYVYGPEDTIFVDPPNKAPMNIYISPNNKVQLPCKVTHPNATVNVYKDSQKLDESTYTLYPKEGVVINENSMSRYGSYKCENPKNSSDTNLFIAAAEVRAHINKPNITTYGNAHYIIGGPLDLNCSIPHRNGITLDWGYMPKNVEVGQPVIVDSGYARLLIPLHIERATTNNSGTYACTAQLANVVSENEFPVIFQEQIDPYVRFTSQNETLVVPEGYFSWKLWFRGYPENISYKFINPYGNVINETNKVNIEYSYIDGRISFNMEKLTPDGFGRYQAKLFTPSKEVIATAYAFVIVSHLPIIRIPRIPLAQAGIPANFSANILSFDGTDEKTALPPNVTWWIHDNCPKGLHSCTDEKTKLNSTLTHDDGPENRWISTVYHTPKSSGIVWCEVTDRIGTSKDRTDWIVTDNTDALSFIVTTEFGETKIFTNTSVEVIEGDDIYFSCNAVRYLYSSLLLKSSDSSVVKSNCETDLTLGRCLSVHNIDYNYTATFSCTIFGHRGVKSVAYHADIKTIKNMGPRMINGSDLVPEGREITATIGKEFSITCQGEGMPPPKLDWFKDGDILEADTDTINITNSRKTLHFPFAVPENTGEYTCLLENRVGVARLTASIEIQGRGWEPWHYALAVIALSGFFILSGIILNLRRRVRKERRLKMELRKNTMYLFEHGNTVDLNPEFTTDEQAELLPYDHSYEIPRDKIRLGKILGSGAFGLVKLARLDDVEEVGKKILGAVKMCKDNADPSQLRSLTVELKIMIHIGRHLNIVNLLGAHTANVSQGELWIIVEYCKYGNLLKFIRKYKAKFINQINPENDTIEVDDLSSTHNPLSPSASIARKTSRCTSLPRSRKTTTASLGGSGSYKPIVGTRNYVGNPEYERMQSTNPPKEEPQEPQRTSTLSEVPEPAYKVPPSRKISVASTTYTCDENGGYYKNGIPMSPLSQGSGGYSSLYGGTLKNESAIPGMSAPFNTSSLLCWAWQMACGMEYLASRKVLHSDLAARNLLLASNNILKISDFGLSREMYKKDVYCKKSDDLMPIKWMSLEAIKERLFSTQSDVWAYGITLWEIFTLGNSPYPGIPVDNDFVVQLENGMRMRQPEYSNRLIYDIMLKCWDLEATERPSFTDLADIFSDMMNPETKEEYLSMNEVHKQRNQQYFEKNTDYLQMVGSPDIAHIQNEEIDANQIEDFESDPNVAESSGAQPMGYLAMGSVCPDSATSEIFSPRPPDANIFQFPTPSADEHLDNTSGFKVNNEFFDKVRQDSKEDEEPTLPEYRNLDAFQEKSVENGHGDQQTTNCDSEIADDKDVPQYLNTKELTS